MSETNKRYVQTNHGQIPLADYLEICSYSYGYDSYKELYDSGQRISGYENVTPKMLEVNY